MWMPIIQKRTKKGVKMTIKDIQKKYELSKDDFWHHQQSGQWILTHDAVEKIANIENIKVFDIKVLNSEVDLVRFLVTMVKQGRTSKTTTRLTTIGEADRKNCHSQYLGCMAEKRGIDRCVLKLINAYQYGISSEVEAEDFAKPTYYQKREEHIEKFAELLDHPYFDGKKKETKAAWKDADSLSTTELILSQMRQRIEQYEKERIEHENQ